MSSLKDFEQEEVTLRQRKMVPRVAQEVDHEMSGDDMSDCDQKDSCENADYNKNDTTKVTDSFIPKIFDKEPKVVSWNFENVQIISESESHKSLIEEQIFVPHTKETMLSIALQVFVPFLIAGFGTVGAGLVLDVVQHWEVFRVVSEIFILVPALLGLKGNLEMTLASRLSTQANLGHMDTSGEQWKLATGNMALIQVPLMAYFLRKVCFSSLAPFVCFHFSFLLGIMFDPLHWICCQATVVGFLASLFAMIMGWIPEGKFNMGHAFLLCASSLVTASLASFILGCVMVGVVIFSRKCSINPDNVATPIAASLGDLTTLCLLAGISYILYGKLDSPGFAVTIILFFLLLVPLWVTIARRNRYTREVLYSGWTPVISAMAISSVGGCILDFAVDRFHGIAVFQPVINGVGGNLVAVQASRISTYLHQRSKLGVLPAEDSNLCKDPISAFFGKSVHSMTARVLMLLVIPGHLVFTYGIKFVNAGHTSVTPMFLTFYLLAAIIQVALLLYCAHVMIHWMWIKEIDPDNSAIPYLTALGDFLGTALLAIAFSILYSIGDKDADVGE